MPLKTKPSKKAEKATNQSTDKMLQILECLAHNRLPIRLQDLAAKLNMSQSTVLRYLKSLQKANYIYQEEDTLRYALTWKVCKLSSQIESYLGLRTITSPYINRLASTFNLGICLVVERDNECVYLDCVDNPQSLSYPLQHIGKRAPLHTTASGKVLLSQYQKSQLDLFIEKKGLESITPHTITDSQALIEELERVRTQGYATDEQECEIGLRCISVPIRDYSGNIIASMSMFGDVSILTPDLLTDKILPTLKENTKTISSRLGYEGHN